MRIPRNSRGIVYDSWKDGSDVNKDSKGYYIIQWDVVLDKEYKNYLPKSWKPSMEYTIEKSKTKKRKSKTNKKRKTIKNKK